MKKRSKLFLLISGIVFAVGVIVSLIGLGVASSSGEQLFPTTRGEDSYYTYSFGDGVTDKIKINVGDAHVNVFGGAEKNYIELVNFNENNTSFSSNGATVSFNETEEIKDITGIWESGVGFRGLRYLFVSGESEGEKAVNIYVTDDEYVKDLEIKLGRGNVEISDFEKATDYSITLDCGKITISNVKTTGALTVNAKGTVSTTLKLDGVSATTTEINAKRAKVNAGVLRSNSCCINVTQGSADMTFVPESDIYLVEVSSKGRLSVNGEEYIDSYQFSNEPPEDSENKKGKDEDEETAVQVSSLKILGDDFSVVLETPEKNTEKQEETAPAAQ